MLCPASCTVRLRTNPFLQKPAAEFGAVHTLARICEQQLFDHLLDVIVDRCLGGAPAAIDLEWKGNVHGRLTFRLRAFA